MNNSQNLRARRICRLELIQNGAAVGGATGFHYENGWIITNSHVTGKDGKKIQDLTIIFDALNITIPPRRRLVFFVDIEFGNMVDVNHADVVAFRLTDQELQQYQLEPGMNSAELMTTPPAVQTAPIQILLRVYTLHYGWGNPYQRPEQIQISQNEVVSNIWRSLQYNQPFVFERQGYNTSPGSSGSPIFDVETNTLVGVHFGSGLGVMFEPAVRSLLNGLLVPIDDLEKIDQLIQTMTATIHLSEDLCDSFVTQINSCITGIRQNLPPFVRIIL